MLPKYGYALVEEELPKDELDDEILSAENEFLQQRLMTDEAKLTANSSQIVKRKLRSSESCDNDDSVSELRPDLNSNYMDDNNNNNIVSLTRRQKSELNFVNLSDDRRGSCPGLATSAVTYKLD